MRKDGSHVLGSGSRDVVVGLAMLHEIAGIVRANT